MNKSHLTATIVSLVISLAAATPPVHAETKVASEVPDSPTIAAIRQRDMLVVGSELKFATMNVKDPVTGRCEGFMADLARALAKSLLGDETKVTWKEVADEGRLNNVSEGRVDLIIDTTGGNPEKEKFVAFSNETFRSGSGLLVRRGSPIRSLDDIRRGTRVIYVKANPDIAQIRARAPDATYLEFENSKDAFAALKEGKGDVFTQVVTHLYRAASQDPDYVLVSRFTNKSYNIALPKDDVAFRAYLDRFLATMRASGDYDRLYHKWFAAYGGDAVR